MNWLFEDPTYIYIAAAIALAVFGIALFQTGRGIYLIWMGSVLALAIVLVLVERFVVTDYERVEATIYGAAHALERNDFEAMSEYLAVDKAALKNEVANRMRTLRVEEARVGELSVQLFELTSPATAEARFYGRLSARMGHDPVNWVGRVRVTLVREGERYLINGYELER